MRVRPFALAVPLACALSGAACSENPPPQQPSGVANVQPVGRDSAAWRLAGARCKHASACNEIGGSRTYASMDACMGKSRGEAQDNLRAANCPRGVDSARLESCLSSVAAEACSGIGSGFNRSMTCRTSQLCP
jgi:hypothetical protein